MSCIDIEMIADTSLLLKNYPEHSSDHLNPTGIKQDEAFMLAAPAQNILKGLATDVLELAAKKGNDIQWRISSAVKTDYYAILYQINLLPPPSSTSRDSATTCPAVTQVSRSCPLPDSDEPTQYAASQYIDTFWRCKVIKSCQQDYELCFYIVQQDDVTGKLNIAGYYSWRATLILKSGS